MNDKREILHLDHLISIISSRSSHLDHLISIIPNDHKIIINQRVETIYTVLLSYLNQMLSSKSSNQSRTMTTIK